MVAGTDVLDVEGLLSEAVGMHLKEPELQLLEASLRKDIARLALENQAVLRALREARQDYQHVCDDNAKLQAENKQLQQELAQSKREQAQTLQAYSELGQAYNEQGQNFSVYVSSAEQWSFEYQQEIQRLQSEIDQLNQKPLSVERRKPPRTARSAKKERKATSNSKLSTVETLTLTKERVQALVDEQPASSAGLQSVGSLSSHAGSNSSSEYEAPASVGEDKNRYKGRARRGEGSSSRYSSTHTTPLMGPRPAPVDSA